MTKKSKPSLDPQKPYTATSKECPWDEHKDYESDIKLILELKDGDGVRKTAFRLWSDYAGEKLYFEARSRTDISDKENADFLIKIITWLVMGLERSKSLNS